MRGYWGREAVIEDTGGCLCRHELYCAVVVRNGPSKTGASQ